MSFAFLSLGAFQHYIENYRILSFLSKWGTISFILGYFNTWKDIFRTIIKHLCTNFTRHEGDCCNIIFLSYCCITVPQERWTCLLSPDRSLTTERGSNSIKTFCLLQEYLWGFFRGAVITHKQLYHPKHTPKQTETCWGCIHRISCTILRQLTEEYIFSSNHLQCINLYVEAL